MTAKYLAEHNEVTAVEPDEESVVMRWEGNQYTQIIGSTDELRKIADATFDMIICHNVFEYAGDREDKMPEIKMRVSDMDGYKDIAFFHHLILEKSKDVKKMKKPKMSLFHLGRHQ